MLQDLDTQRLLVLRRLPTRLVDHDGGGLFLKELIQDLVTPILLVIECSANTPVKATEVRPRHHPTRATIYVI